MDMGTFVLSVLSSLTAIAVLYLLYLASAKYAACCIGTAECWWLPGANTFRFVIRNMSRSTNLFSIRYRSWLRRDVPASDDISVGTLFDDDLTQGERLLLPGKQDLPVICFRLELIDSRLGLLVTNKMGKPQDSREIGGDVACLMVEFSVKACTWILFKHEITRLYAIPQFKEVEGCRRNMFREYLLPMQASHEGEMKSAMQCAREVTVTV